MQDQDGEPVAGAHVTLVRVDPDLRRIDGHPLVDFERPLATSTSAADGTFEFGARSAEPLVVAARKAGYAVASAFVQDEPATEVVLLPADTLEFLAVTEAGDPVAGAQFWRLAEHDAPPQELATTDAEGLARLDWPAEVWSGVAVRAVGFVQQTVEVDESLDDEPQRVVLREARRIAGVVVDGAGKPLDGAVVRLGAPDDDRRDEARTGPDGRFAFDGVDPRPEEHEIWGLLEDWAGEPALAFPGDTDVRVVLGRAGTVRGVVVRPDGAPVGAGQHVDIGDIGDSTDDRGRFELLGVPPGRRVVRATSRLPADKRVELRGEAAVVVPEGGVVDDVRVVTAPPEQSSYVLVRVLDSTGAPRDGGTTFGVWTTDLPPGDRWQPGRSMGLSTWGGATLRNGVLLASVNRPPGTGVIVAVGDREGASACTERTVATEAGPPFEAVVLQLGTAARLRLRLVDSAGVEVPFDPACASTDDPDIRHLVDATYSVPNATQFTASLSLPGFARRRLRVDPPHPPLREETVVLLPATRITGRVLAPDGSPAPESTIVAVTVDAPSGREADSTTLDEDGSFELDRLPPGPAVVRVFDQESALLVFRSVTVAAGTVDLGELHIGERVEFRGSVTDAGGNGIAGAQVFLLDPATMEARAATTTRADGTFDLRLARGLPVRLRVSRGGFGTQVVDASEPCVVTLEAAGSVRVALPSRLAASGASWWIEARRPGTALGWEPRLADDATLVYDDLPSGAIEFVLHAGQGDSVRRVDVVAGRAVECFFDE